MELLETFVLVAMATALFMGGAVKGATGIGLPMVAVPSMAVFVDVPTAVAVMTIPMIVSNLWQALHLGWPGTLLQRFWPVLAALTVTLWWSTGLVADADPHFLFATLGVVVILFCILEFVKVRLRIPPRFEALCGFLAGAAGGVIGGFSSAFAPPITLYFVAIDLPKDEFVRAIGVLLFVGSVILSAFFWTRGLLHEGNIGWSILALVPTFGGLLLGQFLRRRIRPDLFRPILLVLLLCIGLNLLRRAFF